MLNTILPSETISKIHSLLKYLHDSYQGYDECAQMIQDNFLKEKFISAAVQRQDMINSLEEILISNKVMPKDSGTLTGAAHRMLVALKAFITDHDTAAILKEVERGENSLIDMYQETLIAVDNPQIKSLLQKQLTSVQNDLAKWEFAES